ARRGAGQQEERQGVDGQGRQVSAAACPNCNRVLPPSVLAGPAQAVVRCEGCQTLLLWSNGRVMRSARSSTPTVMGMPAVSVPAKPSDDKPRRGLQPEAEETENSPPPARRAPGVTWKRATRQ